MIKHFKIPFAKKIAAIGFALSMTVTTIFTGITETTAYAVSGEYTQRDRLAQPTYSYKFAANELGVVNFTPKWGDKEVNIESMKSYIEEAHTKGVKILLFPEMCVTGYASSSDPTSDTYKMPIENAEPLDGPTAKTFAKIADDYDMWIIYGATQTVEGDKEHAYNSAFACSPEGKVTAYQKITPVEGSWCTPGETPVLIDAGKYGTIGLSICYDTYATPELGRYYAAMGCNILLNPTATSRSYKDIDGDGAIDDEGWEWYYKNRLESNTSREGYTLLSANLVGKDGPTGNYNFPGGSVIMQGTFDGAKYYAGATTAGGTATTDADIITGTSGLLTNDTALTASTGSTCTNQDFNPEMYTLLYKELADKQTAGESLKYSSNVTDGPKAAVVNMTGIWGDKEATKIKMIQYIKEAGEKDVDILVFPETVLSGYSYKTPQEDSFYKEYGVAMQVYTAETIPGETTNELSEYAKQYNMYIIFGMTEKDKDGPIFEDGVEKVYNSAAILYPDGKIESYQKIHRAGSESQWSVCGSNPYMLETKWGKVGIDICRDGHFYPELGRYYAAMGCTLFIHPTATTGNPWYRETRISSYTDRDGMAAITCNLLGGDGTYIAGDTIPDITDAAYWKENNWDGCLFNSTSLIITKYHDPETGKTGVNPKTGYAIDLNGTGSASEGFQERGTSPVGLEIATMNLSGCGFNISNFNPGLFSKMYDKLATLYRGGYTSLYGTSALAEPITIDLTNDDTSKDTPAASVPVKGEKLTDAKTKSVYKVTKSGAKNGTVEYIKNTNTKATSITIPSIVKIDDITYKVTSVAANAFKNNTKITKVTISSNVSKIGAKAFYGCKKLKSITIKTTKLTSKTVGNKAFKGINSKAVIKVPDKKLSSYKKVLKTAGVGAKVKIKK